MLLKLKEEYENFGCKNILENMVPKTGFATKIRTNLKVLYGKDAYNTIFKSYENYVKHFFRNMELFSIKTNPVFFTFVISLN